eukprot:g943.t1
MAGIGAGYDYSAGTYSPNGRIFQIEYAAKATANSGTVVAFIAEDETVVVAAEQICHSPLLVKGKSNRLFKVNPYCAIGIAGYNTDSRFLVNDAREIASQYKDNYGITIPPGQLAKQLAGRFHLFTLYGGIRPLGLEVVLIGHTSQGKAEIYQIHTSGEWTKVFGAAAGKGARVAKTELQTLLSSPLSAEQTLVRLAKTIELGRDDSRDKAYELHMLWIQPGKMVEEVSREKVNAALEQAKKDMEDEESDDEEESEEEDEDEA